MDLTAEEVAELLSLPEETIDAWSTEGKIPGYRINEEYRYSRTEIEDWMLRHRSKDETGITSPFSEILAPATGGRPSTRGGITHFSLYRAIHRGHVLHQVPGKTKEEVIHSAMKAVANDLELDAEVLCDLLLDRERLMPTALNHGIAVPHTRDFLLKAHFDVVTVVFPETPVDYGALDGKPVHTLFFLFACADKRHLNLLAKLAHLASQEEQLEFLTTRPSKQALLERIRGWEADLQMRGG